LRAGHLKDETRAVQELLEEEILNKMEKPQEKMGVKTDGKSVSSKKYRCTQFKNWT
jgi:hypothetical protein